MRPQGQRTARYILISALFSAARMGIGATGVVYMLSRGATLTDIAFIKIIQGVVLVLAELPTGVVADLWGRKTSILLSCVCGIASFMTFIYGQGPFAFGIAEIFNALTISFWSGAFEAMVVDSEEQSERTQTRIGARLTRIDFVSSLCLGMRTETVYLK